MSSVDNVGVAKNPLISYREILDIIGSYSDSEIMELSRWSRQIVYRNKDSVLIIVSDSNYTLV